MGCQRGDEARDAARGGDCCTAVGVAREELQHGARQLNGAYRPLVRGQHGDDVRHGASRGDLGAQPGVGVNGSLQDAAGAFRLSGIYRCRC